MLKAVLGLTENKAFLDDLSEEEIREIQKRPEFQKKFKEFTRIAKERQLKLRQDEPGLHPPAKED